MEFLVTTIQGVQFENKELQKATREVFKLGDTIKNNWFQIATIVARVDNTECYKDDGFNSVHDWVNKTFGIKKSASYTLLTIGREYTREITGGTSGKIIGYGTNLVNDGDTDFSKTQVEKMLPAGHDLAFELVKSGEITPEMSAKEISKIIKSHTSKPESKPESESESESESEPEPNPEDSPHVMVWDEMGHAYSVPMDILNKYAL